MSSEPPVTTTHLSSRAPWQESGAPNFPAIFQLMDIDDDHVVFRKFKRLHLYSLLFQQRQLALIDEEIADMEFEKGLDSVSNLQRFTELLPILDTKLKQYGAASLSTYTHQDTKIGLFTTDKALFHQELLMRLTDTPDRLVKNFMEIAKDRTELAEELNKGNGWNDLVSLGCTPKHWIHTFVDERPQLQKLFETVSMADVLAAPYSSDLVLDPAHRKDAEKKIFSTNLASIQGRRASSPPLLREESPIRGENHNQPDLLRHGDWAPFCPDLFDKRNGEAVDDHSRILHHFRDSLDLVQYYRECKPRGNSWLYGYSGCIPEQQSLIINPASCGAR